ncbi:MAG TPA: hypothetical protein VEA36_02085 [Candidatus Paceibacterota bacterium]|nr:hypothetical protein [Candidatus Paceibacterota bacterium]
MKTSYIAMAGQGVSSHAVISAAQGKSSSPVMAGQGASSFIAKQ